MQILSWVNIPFQDYFSSREVRIEVGFGPIQDVTNGVSVEEACFTVGYVSFCDGKDPLCLSSFHCKRPLLGIFKVVSVEFTVPAVPDRDVIVTHLFGCLPHP